MRDIIHVVSPDGQRRAVKSSEFYHNEEYRGWHFDIEWLLDNGYLPANVFHAQLEGRQIVDEDGKEWPSADEYLQHLRQEFRRKHNLQ